MDLTFTPQEGAALYCLLAEGSSDIIIRTDGQGFILHASRAIDRMGALGGDELFGRHLIDLVQPGHAAAIRAKHRLVAAGRPDDSWTEFAALGAGGGENWFEVRMRRIADGSGQSDGDKSLGVLSVLRSIEEKKSFERRLFVATMTDQLTGLTNRTAFTSMLRHMLEGGADGCLAIFDLDHFKAINLKYGQSVGDDVLVAFAGYLRTAVRARDIISRIGGESLGVLLPGATPAQAETLCRRIVANVAEIGRASGDCGGSDATPGRGERGGEGIPITASAGVARIAGSIDDTIRRAEVALALAKAKGRNRLEMDAAA